MSLHSSSPLSNTSSISPLKRKAMSVTQTYYLAHTARGKLSQEAARSDHNLRLLVGHANLLDSLMLELAEAEQEQESWFNQSVKKASSKPSPEQPKHIQWADTIVEDPEEDWRAEDVEDSDSESEYDSDDEIENHMARLQHVAHMTAASEEQEFEDDEEEDYASLSLHRTNSHSASSSSPPELDMDSDSSEDEAMPPSPPSTSLPTFSEKERRQIATTSFYSKSQPEGSSSIPGFEEGYYISQRAPGLVSAVSVY